MRSAVSLKKVVLAATLVLALSVYFVGPAGAQEGNNGSIKIHEGADEPEDIHKSEPQVCQFHIHAFNFDANQTINWTITNTETGEVAKAGSFTVNSEGNGRDPESGSMFVEDPGSYNLDAVTDDGSKSKTFQVTCEGGVLGGALANTGGDASPYITVAGLLMVMGAGLILRSRRRLWGTPQL